MIIAIAAAIIIIAAQIAWGASAGFRGAAAAATLFGFGLLIGSWTMDIPTTAIYCWAGISAIAGIATARNEARRMAS